MYISLKIMEFDVIFYILFYRLKNSGILPDNRLNILYPASPDIRPDIWQRYKPDIRLNHYPVQHLEPS